MEAREPVEEALHLMQARLDRLTTASAAAHLRTDQALGRLERWLEHHFEGQAPWSAERRAVSELVESVRRHHEDELRTALDVGAYAVLDPLRGLAVDLDAGRCG